MLRALIVGFNGADESNFVVLARQCDGVASSGERVLLHAILYVTDFASLADELAEGKAWQHGPGERGARPRRGRVHRAEIRRT